MDYFTARRSRQAFLNAEWHFFYREALTAGIFECGMAFFNREVRKAGIFECGMAFFYREVRKAGILTGRIGRISRIMQQA
jgi:hypothetical protein